MAQTVKLRNIKRPIHKYFLAEHPNPTSDTPKKIRLDTRPYMVGLYTVIEESGKRPWQNAVSWGGVERWARVTDTVLERLQREGYKIVDLEFWTPEELLRYRTPRLDKGTITDGQKVSSPDAVSGEKL